jgi:hypothetical protein
MLLNEEQLEIIEQMGYRLFTPEKVAINIEVEEDEFIQEITIPGTKARIAYYKGIIRQESELREAIIKAAGNGSNPAQEQLIKMLNQIHQ